MPVYNSVRVTAVGIVLPAKPNKLYVVKDFWIQLAVSGAFTCCLYFGPTYDNTDVNGINGIFAAGNGTTALVFRDQRYASFGNYLFDDCFTGNKGEGVGFYASGSATIAVTSHIRYIEV